MISKVIDVLNHRIEEAEEMDSLLLVMEFERLVFLETPMKKRNNLLFSVVKW